MPFICPLPGVQVGGAVARRAGNDKGPADPVGEKSFARSAGGI